jgi:hypothetical protein
MAPVEADGGKGASMANGKVARLPPRAAGSWLKPHFKNRVTANTVDTSPDRAALNKALQGKEQKARKRILDSWKKGRKDSQE